MAKIPTELLYPTEFFYRYAIQPGHVSSTVRSLEPVSPGTSCFVCGRNDFAQGVAKAKAIGPLFTDYDSCKSLHSTHLCQYCAQSLTDGPDRRGPRRLLMYTVSQSGVLLFPQMRPRDIITGGLEPPFLIALGDAQKHTVHKAKVSLSRDYFFVYDVKAQRLREVDRLAALAYATDLKHLAGALHSAPYAVARSNFGSAKLATLTEDDRRLYDRLAGHFHTDLNWAALEALRKYKTEGDSTHGEKDV